MRHIHRLLQQCLDQAIRDGLLTENPAKAFRYRKSTTVKANIMTPLEMEDYLDAAEQLGYLPMFMLALTTGLRQGELIALKWSDLDIESRTLTIAENREQLGGCTVHTYNDGDLIACFDANIPESVVKEIAQRKPLRAVFRDSGFASSPEKINVFEIFKLYMPEDANDISKRVRVI